jgi:phosphopantothenoylcysteine decarboxylase/phosphopantothenate--cysteine ligase
MREAVLGALPTADVLVMAAAVADFRPRRAAGQKLTREAGLMLELEPTEDILAEASSRVHATAAEPSGTPADAAAPAGDRAIRTVLVGFAAETGSLERAPEKAARKRLDLLVANDVSEPGSGFGTDTNRVTFVVPGQPPRPLPMLTKAAVAQRLLDEVRAIRGALGASSGPHPAGARPPHIRSDP